MASIKDYLNLIAPEYIPMGITGLLVGAVATLGALPDYRFILAAVCFCFIIAGYNSYNAIIDKEVDKINKPHRPLPKGTLTEKDALYFAVVSYIIAIVFAALLDGMFFLLALVTILITIAYSHPRIHLKKRFFIGTLTAVILYTLLAPLLGWSLYANNPIPIPIIIFLFFLGLPKGVMKDYVDILGDSHNHIKSLPVRMGYQNSVLAVILSYLFSAILVVFLIYEQIVQSSFLLLLLFYPFMFWNAYTLLEKTNTAKRRDLIFIKAMIILILMEIAIAGLIAYGVKLPFSLAF